MAEQNMDWVGLTERWQRLAWARQQAGFTQLSFNRRLGLKSNLYGFHERDPAESAKSTELTYDKAVAWAPVLKVRWEWLLHGTGEPWLESEEPTPRDRAMKAFDRVKDPAEQARLATAIEALTGTGG